MTKPKVRLRAFERNDLEVIYKFFNNPELVKFLSPEAVMPYSREEEAAFIENSVNPKNKEKTYNFAIANAREELVGGCSYMDASMKNRTCYIGISIYDPRNWGKGYGTSAIMKLLDFLFLEKNMRKVLLNVYDFNERAIACYEKLGFRQEGCLKEQVYRDGKYSDMYIMALFADDYARKKANK